MSLSIGIVGLPNVGKSTLFNALTDSRVLAANYPFATIEPNTGLAPIPDERLHKLSALYGNAPIKPATVRFVDIAGLVAGASRGEGLGNQFLAHIRDVDAVAHVVRAFDDPDVQHVDERPDPAKDIALINTELALADLQTIERHLPKLKKEAKANPKLKPRLELIRKAHDLLANGTPLHQTDDVPSSEFSVLGELQLLTMKPVIYLFNVDEQTRSDESGKTELANLVAPAQALFVRVKLESELRGLNEADRRELLGSYDQTESGLAQLIRAAYGALGRQSFLTAGPKEVRAWTIAKGATAPQAAGVVHSDFERGFIAAQVISYPDLIAAGSVAAARAAGQVATVGKNYVMRPDDVVEFRFNVSR